MQHKTTAYSRGLEIYIATAAAAKNTPPPAAPSAAASSSSSAAAICTRLRANAGALANFEVLDFLRSRGAAKDPSRIIVPIAPSEFKVCDYLEKSVACIQTREIIKEFLAEAEILNIINIRPSSVVEIDQIIEEWDMRMGESAEELIALLAKMLPPHPTRLESDETIGEDKEGISVA
ncbi:hypothetical protein ACSBR2_013274 [Camellia fascicularis]